ncbi:PQQ-binding-like beta-propeller repeat protein [Halohasta salina]|uniref:outer membrane protein assembly factor BamB family protein n=1 Tax=Halohasta salina TaxID=2961621 RepID=UPI0020A4D3F6|nr:PQQ-binding-like beta-propeller repeat protein [Halohasta salina]
MSDVTVPDRGTPAWNGGSATTVPPLIAGETVYSVSGELTALDAQTGQQRWETDLDVDSPGGIVTQPAVSGDRILLGLEGKLRSFDPDDGSEQWEQPIDGVPIGPITVSADDGIAVVPFERPSEGDPIIELIGVSITSGQTEWTAQMLASVRTTPPAVRDEQVYAAGYTQEDRPILRCFGIETGDFVWEQQLTDPSTPPVATEDGVFIGEEGQLSIYDLVDGEPTGSITVSDRPISAFAVTDTTAFVLDGGGLSALSITDGTEQWSVEGTPQADGLAVGENAVVAPISSDRFPLDTSWPCIAAFSRNDGTVQWYHAIDDTFDPVISTPPVIADGAVLMISNQNSGITALGDLPPQEE